VSRNCGRRFVRVGVGFQRRDAEEKRRERLCGFAEFAEHQLRHFFQRLKNARAVNRSRFDNRLTLALKFFFQFLDRKDVRQIAFVPL
jgi:site-specific recombinase XerD